MSAAVRMVINKATGSRTQMNIIARGTATVPPISGIVRVKNIPLVVIVSLNGITALVRSSMTTLMRLNGGTMRLT